MAGGGDACVPPGPERQRPWRNQRRIVATDGARAGPGRRSSRARSSWITRPGGSPAAHRLSASARRIGQVYDPGRSRGAGEPRAAWNRSSARERCAVKHPDARHTCIRETTRSRPARRARNPGSRCAAHSHTDTPPGRCNSARAPCPAPTQIAHAGVFPSRSPL